MRTVGSIVAVALLASTAAQAGDAVLPARAVPVAAASNDATVAWQPALYPTDWDKRIGDDFWTRFINYYALEWGHDVLRPKRKPWLWGQIMDALAAAHDTSD